MYYANIRNFCQSMYLAVDYFNNSDCFNVEASQVTTKTRRYKNELIHIDPTKSNYIVLAFEFIFCIQNAVAGV